jgi:hypothetical protein
MNWYKVLIETVTIAFIALAIICGIIATGLVARLVWHGLSIGWNLV